MTHIPDSFGFRISVAGGAHPGIVYSGDCGNADDLLPLIRPGDTLLSEAAFGDGEGDGGNHLTARQAAAAARASQAGRLILTHILDRFAASRPAAAAALVYDQEIIVAEPGLRITVD